ncbi:hypothetical protein SNOG_12385 [Parastagonospora nodorum SN15]|uniref:Uncharacterized protein n=1 Tax=Phaeosphaeria nodorum (strain SN15 / ATCC MYA-4574 / FGSC 10173) TaxID=321614 RepID=Q0U779_PHANO|nr:hypothetical protein SNOG_12385 [Parastagonospora nodorum SN15]EAT80198.1 hypothetical protein SNOG_12385 [Parastagonospora nodorum SN15]
MPTHYLKRQCQKETKQQIRRRVRNDPSERCRESNNLGTQRNEERERQSELGAQQNTNKGSVSQSQQPGLGYRREREHRTVAANYSTQRGPSQVTVK